MAIAPLQLPTTQVNSLVPQSMWSSLSNLGNVARDAQEQQQKQATLSNLGPDIKSNTQALIGSGVPSLVQLGLTLQEKLVDQSREDARYAVTDRRADVQTGILQSQEARAAEKDEQDTPTWRAKNLVATAGPDALKTPEGQAYVIGPGYKGPTPSEYEIKDVNGQLVRVKKSGPEGPIAGQPTPVNPLMIGGKMNHDEAQAATYTDRMAQAHDALNGLEGTNQGVVGATTGTIAETARDIPHTGAVRNWFLSADRQKLEQAQRNFVNALLRKESGAAISPSEFENARQQYFPQPGDDEAAIAQKQQNRLTAMRGMAREAGASYHAPDSIVPPELRRPPSGQGTGADEALRMARNDLANRVPREQVVARLKAQGIDPTLLDSAPPKAQPAKTVAKTGTVNEGPNKGKTVILYSDGTKEYK
jgi:hypothetical protein